MVTLLETLGADPLQFKIAQIFHGHSLRRVEAALNAKTRFVHYTNADKAMKILEKKEVWLRKSSQMNDFMEVEHGYECLSNAYRKQKPSFETQLEELFPGICSRIENYFDGWLPTYRTGTYLACVSEHDDSPDRNEDSMGRLSMWRAYGGSAGVAIVMTGDVFHKPVPSDELKAYTSPVAYHTVASFEAEFQAFIEGILANLPLMQQLGEEEFFARIVETFRYATLCTKHLGFLEEKEWRIIYNPAIERSKVIVEAIESIGGVPQRVCKLPLIDHPDLGIVGLKLSNLVDRVIVGPCQYPYDIYEALTQLLEQAGVQDASSKVVISEIPLRHGN